MSEARGTDDQGSVVASDAFFPFADGCWSRSRPAPPP